MDPTEFESFTTTTTEHEARRQVSSELINALQEQAKLELSMSTWSKKVEILTNLLRQNQQELIGMTKAADEHRRKLMELLVTAELSKVSTTHTK